MNEEIKAYNSHQADDPRLICELLAKKIQRALPEAENKRGTVNRFGLLKATLLWATMC